MLLRFELGLKPQVRDVVGERVARKIKSELGLSLSRVGIVRVFTVEGVDEAQAGAVMDAGALHDPVLHEISLSPLAKAGSFAWVLEVGFRPGVTDNEAKTARETIALVLGMQKDAPGLAVYTSTQYLLSPAAGEELDEKTVLHIARDLLANELIQRFEYKSAKDWAAEPGFKPKAARVTGQAFDRVGGIQDHRGGDHVTHQGAATHLVHPGNQLVFGNIDRHLIALNQNRPRRASISTTSRQKRTFQPN